MTSQINFNNIDGTYPIAGQDNSSQGFRDNFTNTKNNFQIAYNEITDLQSKVILKSPLNNGTFNNDMQGNLISNPKFQGVRELIYDIGTNVSGSITVDFNTGSYQTMTLAGSTSIGSFANFSGTAGSFARLKLQVTVPNSEYTLTFPSSVSVNVNYIAGWNSSNRTVTFDGPGVYVYELNTVDGGSSFNLIDLTNNKTNVMGGNLVISTGIANVATNGIEMTVTNIGGVAVGNITATNFIGNIISVGPASVSVTGNITGNYVVANLGLSGTLITSVQPNITSLGNLTSLTVTGNAIIGNATVNGMTDMCGGDMYGVQFVNATDGGSTLLYSNVGLVIINPTSSTISAHTIVMPGTYGTAANGQVIRIAFANAITSLTQNGQGSDSIYGNYSTANTSVGGTWVYYRNAGINSGNGVWYRIG
jgi:hypothetical protein